MIDAAIARNRPRGTTDAEIRSRLCWEAGVKRRSAAAGRISTAASGLAYSGVGMGLMLALGLLIYGVAVVIEASSVVSRPNVIAKETSMSQLPPLAQIVIATGFGAIFDRRLPDIVYIYPELEVNIMSTDGFNLFTISPDVCPQKRGQTDISPPSTLIATNSVEGVLKDEKHIYFCPRTASRRHRCRAGRCGGWCRRSPSRVGNHELERANDVRLSRRS